METLYDCVVVANGSFPANSGAVGIIKSNTRHHCLRRGRAEPS